MSIKLLLGIFIIDEEERWHRETDYLDYISEEEKNFMYPTLLEKFHEICSDVYIIEELIESLKKSKNNIIRNEAIEAEKQFLEATQPSPIHLYQTNYF